MTSGRKPAPVVIAPPQKKIVDLHAELVKVQQGYLARNVIEVPNGSNRDPKGIIQAAQIDVTGTSGNWSYCICGALHGAKDVARAHGVNLKIKTSDNCQQCFNKNPQAHRAQPAPGLIWIWKNLREPGHGHAATIETVLSGNKATTIEWNITLHGVQGIHGLTRSLDPKAWEGYETMGYVDPFDGLVIYEN